MARSREKIQQHGFWDTQVSQSEHDTIVHWLHANAERLLPLLLPRQYGRAWSSNDYFGCSPSAEFLSSNPRPAPRIVRRELESVLVSRTGYRGDLERIVGYADLVISVALPQIEIGLSEAYGAESLWAEPPPSDAVQFDGNNRAPPYRIGWNTDRPVRVLIEAKSVLPTLGELMRQLNLYRTAFQGIVAVAAPDDRYKDILADQGVAFIRYPDLP
jgi:hypothetical protein